MGSEKIVEKKVDKIELSLKNKRITSTKKNKKKRLENNKYIKENRLITKRIRLFLPDNLFLNKKLPKAINRSKSAELLLNIS